MGVNLSERKMSRSGIRRRVVHITSVHPRTDTRILLKECASLAVAGFEVYLVVADGFPDEIRSGARVVSVRRQAGRLSRMFLSSRAVIQKALSLDADIYHLHDPELLPFVAKLKAQGKTVIFDAHEDLPRQILSKPYLWAPLKGLVAAFADFYETRACRRADCVVAATPTIRDKFAQKGCKSVDINNFPMLDELSPSAMGAGRQPQVCYIGGISTVRGIRELVGAMALVKGDVRLALAGNFNEAGLAESLEAAEGWGRVKNLGWVDRAGIKEVLSESAAGLVTLHPTQAYLDSLPVKMFEYMSAGLPVIASKFPLWREIVEGNQCGLCVDPSSPQEIAMAIDYLIANPAEALSMGENGRRAVLDKFNWSAEERKLISLCEKLGSRNTESLS